MKFAAIDIGSNSIKLVVVDAAASDSFAVLTREKETVRLQSQVAPRISRMKSGFLSVRSVACFSGQQVECVRKYGRDYRKAFLDRFG